WRKNRQPNKGTTCVGTDPNRNWDVKWSDAGSSANPCSEGYHGTAPFSAPEPKNVAMYLQSRAPNVVSYIDFHAYSQLWMYPYGFDCSKFAKPVVEEAGVAASKALKAVNGKTFAVGSICNIIYQSSGSSVDWAYEKANVTFAYGVELRDQGMYGFLLPAKQIIPSGEETFAAVMAMSAFIAKEVL
ncbi:Carboxypeptidase A4, partial [Blyttiomyces sp. JEL0837]